MSNHHKASRLFASLLVIGGITGIAIAIRDGVRAYTRGEFFGLLLFLLAMPFIWSIYTGVQLWRGTSYGRKWAPVIYASQVPIIKIPGALAYAWFTGFEFSPQIRFGNGDTFFDFDSVFGAIAQFAIGSNSTEYVIGCNIVAVAALITLLRANMPSNPEK